MRLISWVTPSWTQKLPLAGSWKQKSRIFWSVRLHMKADRNMLVLSFHLLVPYELKMDLQCSSGKRVLQTLGMGISDYLDWVLAGNRYWCGINFLTPFLSTHLGIKEQIGIHQWPTPSPTEISSVLYVQCCIMGLVTCPFDLCFVFHVWNITGLLHAVTTE